MSENQVYSIRMSDYPVHIKTMDGTRSLCGLYLKKPNPSDRHVFFSTLSTYERVLCCRECVIGWQDKHIAELEAEVNKLKAQMVKEGE